MGLLRSIESGDRSHLLISQAADTQPPDVERSEVRFIFWDCDFVDELAVWTC